MRNTFTILTLVLLALFAAVPAADAQLFLLNEEFEGITSGVPTGWDNTEGTTTTTSYRWYSHANGHTGRGLRFNSYINSSGNTNMLKTPTLDLSSGCELSFWYKNAAGGQFDVYLLNDLSSTAQTPIATNLPQTTTWTKVTYQLGSLSTSSAAKIVFKGTSNYGDGDAYIYLDDVQVSTNPTCAWPENMTVTSLATTAATISWGLTSYGSVPSGYTLIVADNAGTAVFNGTIPAGLSYSLTGLTPNTTYNVLLSGDCNATYDGTSGPVSMTFTTPCPTQAAPLYEDFASADLPACTFTKNAALNSTNRQGTTGYSLALTTTANDEAYIIFPELALASDSVEVEFYLKAQSVTVRPKYMIGLVTDLADIQGSFEPLKFDSLRNTAWQLIRMNTMQTAYGTQPAARICILIQSGANTTCYLDNVDIHHIPSCVRPEDVTVTGFTTTSATLSWTSTNATSVEAMIIAAGDTTYQTLTSNPGTITGLSPNTEYNVYIRGNCGTADLSVWSRSATFVRTLCATADSVYFAEGFESLIPTIQAPECWSQGFITRPQANEILWPFAGNNSGHSGSGYQLARQTLGTVAYLSSRAIPVATAGAYDVSIWVRRDNAPQYAGETLQIYASPTPNSTVGATLLGTISRNYASAPAEPLAGWYNYTYPITVTGNLHILIVGNAMNGGPLFFDDVAVINHVNCRRVTNITAGTPTLTDMPMSWTPAGQETQWEVNYRLTQGNTVVRDTTEYATASTFAISNLSPSNTYFAQGTVRAICGPGDTSTVSNFAFNFSTLCGTINTFPVVVDFESASLPNCWANASTGSGGDPSITTLYKHGGQRAAWFHDQSNSTYSYIATPLIDFGQGSSFDISFWFRRSSYNSSYTTEGIHLLVGPDSADLSTATEIGFVPRELSAAPVVASVGFYQYEFTLTPQVATGQKYVFFQYTNQYGEGGYLDDIVIERGSSCPKLNGTVQGVTEQSITIAIADSTATDWAIAYGPQGTAVENCTQVVVSNQMSYTITGLAASTAYDCYTRRICSAGDSSFWNQPRTATTTRTPARTPYVCGFEDDAVNSGWTFVSTGDNHFGIGTDAQAVAAGQKALYVQNNGSYIYEIDDDPTDCHAYTLIHFDARGYQLELKWKSTGGESSYDYGRIMLVPASIDPASLTGNYSHNDVIDFGQSSSTSRYELNVTTGDANGWNLVSEFLDMTAAPGNYYLVCYWRNDDSMGNPTYPLAIDNINIYELSCINPTVSVSGLTSTSATLTYNKQGATAYEVVVSPQTISVDQITDNSQFLYRSIDTTGTTVLTGLAPNTQYYYTIRTYCSTHDTAAWSQPATFTTFCSAVIPPYSEGFEIETSANCWTELGMNDDNNVSRSTAYRHQGNASLKVEEATIISPELNVDSAGGYLSNYMINGWAYATQDSARIGVGVIVDPNDAATYESLGDVLIPQRNKWTEFTAYFSALTDDDYADFLPARNIVMACGANTIYFDDILVDVTPTCPKPTEVTINNITSNSFDISFVDNAGATSWIVDAGGQQQVITTNPATITGLAPHREYTVRIAAICSATDTSYYTLAGQITTACAPMPLPWSCGFEAVDGFRRASGTYYAGYLDENCWTVLNAKPNGQSYPYYYISASTIYSGTASLYFYSLKSATTAYKDLVAILPELQGSANAVEVSFFYMNGSITSTHKHVQFGYMLDAAVDTSFVLLEDLPLITNWERVTIRTADYPNVPQNARLAFRHAGGDPPTGNAYISAYIDDITVSEVRNCTAPMAPTVSDITASTAVVSFLDTVAAHTAWQYVYGPQGTDPNDASLTPQPVDTSHTFTLTGLTDDTEYHVFVRAVCAPGDESGWRMASFHTSCLPFAVTVNNPFIDDFETQTSGVQIAGCYTTENATSSYCTKGYVNTSLYDYAYSGQTCLYTYNNNIPDGQKFSRKFYLQAGHTYEASIMARATSYNSDIDIIFTPDDDPQSAEVAVHANVATCSSHYIEGKYNYAHCWQEVVGGYTAPTTGVYTMTIRQYRADAPAGYFYLYLDMLTLQEFTCPHIRIAPQVSHQTATTARVSVDMMNNNEVEIGWAASNAPTTLNLLGTQLSSAPVTTVTGLTPATNYVFFYRIICEPGDTSNWSPASETVRTFADDCFEPQYIAIRSLTDATATIEWFAAPNTQTADYELRYDTVLLASGNTAADTARFTGLSSAHTYTFRLRSLCSGNDTSAWSAFSFITEPGVVEAPFVCDFEDTDFNHQWVMSSSVGNNSFVVGTASTAVNSGLRGLYVSNNGVAHQYSHGESKAVASMLVSIAPGDWLISYDWKSNGEVGYDGGHLFLVPDTTTRLEADYLALPDGAISLDNRAPLVGNSAWTTNLSTYTNSTTQPQIFRLVASWINDAASGSQPPLAIDNLSIQPITCAYPTRVKATDFSQTGITMIVTRADANTELRYAVSTTPQPDDSTVWTSITAPASVDSILITGLTPSTNYYFLVRHACDAQNLSPVLATQFFTLSPGVATMPLVCSFESTENLTGWQMSLAENQFVVGTADASNGTSSLYISDDGTSWNYTPDDSYAYATLPIAFTRTGTVTYSFDWKCKGEGNSNYAYDYGRAILVPADKVIPQDDEMADLDNLTTPADAIALDNGAALLQNENSWQTVNGSFSVPGAGMYKLVFYWTNDGSICNQPPLAVDNIRMDYLSCPKLTTNNVRLTWNSQTSATVKIFGNNEGADLRYLVSTDAAFTDTVAYGISPASADTCVIRLDSLTLNTVYRISLVSVCGPDDESEPALFNFQTECTYVNQFPWEEGFEAITPKNINALSQDCWFIWNSDGLSSDSRWACAWPASINEGTDPIAAHTGSQGLLTANSSSATVTSTLITGLPLMENINGKWLTFWSREATNFVSGAAFEVGYLTRPSDPTSFVNIQNITLAADWAKTEIHLTMVPDSSRVCIRSIGAGYGLFDDFRVFDVVQGPVYTDTVCNNQSYIANGFNVPFTQLTVGDNRLTRYIVGAADTLVTANVYRLAEISDTVTDVICGGMPYNVGLWNIPNPTTRLYRSTFTGASHNGCDSTVYLNLTVLAASHVITDTICANDSYQFGDQTITLPGMYTRQYTSQEGCTVNDTLYLMQMPDSVVTNETICQNQLPYTWNNQQLTQSGTYTTQRQGQHGCMQTLVFNLTVIPQDSVVNVTFCRGGSVQVVDTIITTAGQYTMVRVNPQGCDITYHVTAVSTDPVPEEIYEDACEGKLFYGHGINGLAVTGDTVVVINTVNAGMCDSVANIHIAYHATQYGDTSVTINPGETFTWYYNTYNATGDYRTTLQDRFGCDSVVTLHLTVRVGVDNVTQGSIRIVPNPAVAGQAAVVFLSNTGDIDLVEIINSFGGVVESFRPHSTPLDLRAPLAPGVYHVRLTAHDGTVYVEKLIVK